MLKYPEVAGMLFKDTMVATAAGAVKRLSTLVLSLPAGSFWRRFSRLSTVTSARDA